ncbi:hypothetical protein [Ruegeria lacuscaerulensis]|uniref:hypothetical protein n=1 Tax=Ruegeria lacuscaerulensis TaxID=55218 RepID=UPI00147E58CC|nr:hypothetical protein [Ruegeria lacuscaerulensis]
MTILIPFVGYLVVFNPSFINFFQQELPGGIPNTYDWFSELHGQRLVFLYFGLLFLGLGNLLFVILAPDALRKHSDVSGYITEMQGVASQTLIANKLTETVSRFLNANEGEARSPFFYGQSLSFPSEASGYLHDLIGNLWRDISPSKLPDLELSYETPGTFFEGSPYTIYTGSGYLQTDNIMEIMTAGNAATFALLHLMHAEAEGRSKEVFFVEFYSLSFSKFLARAMVGLFFLLGFGALLVPTLTTSTLVMMTAFQKPM